VIDPLAIAAALCRRFEGLYLKPYLCPAGVPTIGYGATFYEDGTRVTLKDPAISRERAEALLLWHLLNVYLPAVAALCPDVDDAERLAALIDFTFNLGAGNLRSSTLRRKVNAGQWDQVPGQLLRWNKAGGQVLRGLTLRREAEAAMV
jgi:lysozyme